MITHKYLWALLIAGGSVRATSYLTYGLSGGRLGDNIASYMHAKWIAYKYGLTLAYKPFEYSDQLVLHDQELHLSAVPLRNCQLGTCLLQETLTVVPPIGGFRDNTLYTMPYCCSCVKTVESKALPPLSEPDWSDELFMREIRLLVAPKDGVLTHLIVPPADKVSIAVHARLGGGFDILSTDPSPRVRLPRELCEDVALPGTFPPYEYYLTCLRTVISLFHPDTKFYIHIFTDHQRPLEVVQRYATDLGNARIEWGYREGNQGPNHNVLEDLFSMCGFNVLVMPASNYSWVAAKIGYCSLVVQPAHIVRIGIFDVIDQVEWTINGKSYRKAVGEVPL